MFGVFDGHGGASCADYLKDTLHVNIINQKEFPNDIATAIKRGVHQTESNFLSEAFQGTLRPHNKAGTCALLLMIIDSDIWLVNVGDSRAITSVTDYPSGNKILYRAQLHRRSEAMIVHGTSYP